MKRCILLIMGLVLVLLTACTPMIYGVPQETWERMSEPERVSAIEAYNQRQIARQQAAEERARQHAIYLEEKRLQEAAEAEALRQRVEAIYRGDGNYGDLLRVHVENGLANFHGQERQYSPVTFQIANGELKTVIFETTKNRRVELMAFYDGATLILDDKAGKKGNAAQLHYDKRWQRGLTYDNVYTNNRAKLKGADITVQVVGEPTRHGHYGGNTTIIINEQPRERVVYRNHPQTVVIKEQPQKVIIKEKPSKVIVIDNSHEKTVRYRQKQEQLKKERDAIERERETLAKEQAQFDAEQRALQQERKDLAEKRERVKQMKKEAARDKRQATQEKSRNIQEREQAVKELEQTVAEKEQAVAKKEKVVAKKEKIVKEKNEKVKKQEKEVEKQEKQVEKELKAMQKDEKDKTDDKGKTNKKS